MMLLPDVPDFNVHSEPIRRAPAGIRVIRMRGTQGLGTFFKALTIGFTAVAATDSCSN